MAASARMASLRSRSMERGLGDRARGCTNIQPAHDPGPLGDTRREPLPETVAVIIRASCPGLGAPTGARSRSAARSSAVRAEPRRGCRRHRELTGIARRRARPAGARVCRLLRSRGPARRSRPRSTRLLARRAERASAREASFAAPCCCRAGSSATRSPARRLPDAGRAHRALADAETTAPCSSASSATPPPASPMLDGRTSATSCCWCCRRPAGRRLAAWRASSREPRVGAQAGTLKTWRR